MYMVYCAINLFTSVGMIGLAIQNQAITTVFENGSSPVIFQLAIMIALLVYYIIAIVVCFYAYREFKGMLVDAGAPGGGMMGLPSYGVA